MLIIDIKTGSAKDLIDTFQLIAYREMVKLKDNTSIKDLQFVPDTHTYRYKGKVVPSVTQILSLIDNSIDFYNQEGAERGTYVHRRCHELDENRLDYQYLENNYPEILPYIYAYTDFLYHYKLSTEAVENELFLFHPVFQYAGTLDKKFPGVEPGKYIIWNLYLDKNGSFKVKDRTKKATKEEFNRFLCMLTTWNLKNQK